MQMEQDKELTGIEKEVANYLLMLKQHAALNAKMRLMVAIIEIVASIGGIVMLWNYACWQVSVGALLLLFGNNLMMNRNAEKIANRALSVYLLDKLKKK